MTLSIRSWTRKWAPLACIAAFAGGPAAHADRVDEALVRGAKYLISQQDGNGGISNKGKSDTAMTSLAILALCSLGHQPNDPTPEGGALRRALSFILRPELQGEDGYFGQKDNSRMYGH